MVQYGLEIEQENISAYVFTADLECVPPVFDSAALRFGALSRRQQAQFVQHKLLLFAEGRHGCSHPRIVAR